MPGIWYEMSGNRMLLPDLLNSWGQTRGQTRVGHRVSGLDFRSHRENNMFFTLAIVLYLRTIIEPSWPMPGTLFLLN